jgi:hypothetical protein
MTPDLHIPEVIRPGFAFRAALEGDGLQLRLIGSADARATSELAGFVAHAHAEARRLSVREVVVDLHGCTFMNSSCFKAFLTWLAAIAELSPDAQYRLRFAWDGASYWQRRSLQALKTYAIDLVQL